VDYIPWLGKVVKQTSLHKTDKLLLFFTFREVALAVIFGVVDFEPAKNCSVGLLNLKNYLLGYLIMVSVSIVIEIVVFWVSLRGTILQAEPRECMQYLLYTKLGK
jgi:hypothetical protein